jgi:LacI family transcriptional regulator
MSGRTAGAQLKDVALAAGVSATTVSRYLNHKLVLPENTAARIETAIGRLGYQPNPHARRLGLGRSETVGLIIPDIANPFFAQLADAVQQAAEQEGLEMLLCATRNRPERELSDLMRLRRHHVDGLLFVTNHADDGSLAAALGAGDRVVLMDEDVAGTVGPKVFADNFMGGTLAARHLIAAGHRRLAIAGGPPGLLSTAERHAGFHAAVAAAGPPHTVVFEDFGGYGVQPGRDAAARMLDMDAPPSAVFATSDEIALGLMEVARARGIAVPAMLSIVAFDDIGPLHLLDPPLSAIRQPVAAMGRCGVALLVAALRGEDTPRLPARLAVELVERASVVAPPTTTEP